MQIKLPSIDIVNNQSPSSILLYSSFFWRTNKLNIFLLCQALWASFSCSCLVFFQILPVSFLKCLKPGTVLRSLCWALKNNYLLQLPDTPGNAFQVFKITENSTTYSVCFLLFPQIFPFDITAFYSYSPFYTAYTVPFVNTAWFWLISHCWISGHFCNLLWSFWHLILPSKGCQPPTYIYSVTNSLLWCLMNSTEEQSSQGRPCQDSKSHTQRKAWHNYSKYCFLMRCSAPS